MATLAPRASSVNLAGAQASTLPSSSLKPRPVLKRTRDDSSDMEIPSSPSKRSRVTFDSDVEYVSADEDDEVDPQLIHEQVRRAIQRHVAGGDDEAYEKVKQIFTADPTKENTPSQKAVHAHLQAILAHISSLDKSCNALVNAVLFCEWAGRDESFVKLYIKVLGNLAAAKSGFLGKILHTIVDLLGEQRTRRLPDHKIVRQPRIHSRARRAIVYLLNLVPATSSTLTQVIQRKLTMDYRKPRERLLYTRNFLALLEDAPELKAAVLSMITSELIKLDVSVQVDMEDYADELGEEIVQEVSSSQTLLNSASQVVSLSKATEEGAEDEEDCGSTTSDDEEDDEDDLDPTELRRRKVMVHLETVDAVMELLFEYYHPLVLSSSLEVSEEAMNLLTTHFSNHILPTYRSRHAQFLIFHFSQTCSVFVDKYATTCISTLLDHNQPPVLRQTAGSYLAGFVGRGAQVPLPVIKDCFQLLCDELGTLRRAFEPSCRGPDLKRYASFYSMMQAIMYIFCFRWRDLVDSGDDSDDEQRVEEHQLPYSIKNSLDLAINSSLNPLRICTPDIVNQFAETCLRLRLFYLFPKIENNKHVRLPNTRRSPEDLAMGQIERDLGWVGESGMLEGYFPFDPYRLPRSGRWIADDYLEWKGLPGDEEDEEDHATEDDVMNDELDIEEEGTATDEDA
jgi:RNA polymerase I-specific transcription initiation factor RRN3